MDVRPISKDGGVAAHIGERVAIGVFFKDPKRWVVYGGTLENYATPIATHIVVAYDTILGDDNSVLALNYVKERQKMEDQMMRDVDNVYVILP